MKFSCPSCSAKYQIADEKVEGRTVKMKCRKCGTVIPIRANPSKKSLAAAPVVQAQSLKPKPAGAPGALRSARLPKIDAPAPPSIPTQPPPAEWHAGIGGSAVGPLTFRDLERRIMDGEITSDTFIWREGMDGWKQVPDVPEVAPLLESIVMAGPPSMPAVAKSQAQEPAADPKPVPAPKPAAPAKPAAVPKPAVAHKSALLTPSGAGPASNPLAGLTASNPMISEAGAPAPIPSLQAPADEAPSIPAPGNFDDDFEFPSEKAPEKAAPELSTQETAPASEQHSMGNAPAAPSAATVAALKGTSSLPPSDEAPMPPVAAAPDSSAPYEPSYDSLVMQLHKKRSNKWAIPFTVIMAIGLGLAVGFVLFGDQETKIIRQIVEVPAQIQEAREHKQAVAQEGSAETDVASATAKETEEVAGTKAKATGSKSPSSAAATDTSKEAEKVSEGLKGLSGLQGLGGPTGGPSAGSGTTGGGRPLESSQIQRVVSQYQTSVKRGCWQPALMTRDKDAPSSARVSVAITVSPSGSVTKASTSGDPKGYGGLSSCISRKVRGWQFPRSSGTTTVNVPFVFAAQ